MAHPRYGLAFQAIRKQWAFAVSKGGIDCHERICLMDTREIIPGEPWDLCHAPNGRIAGPAHRRCNRSEGATRGNIARANRFLKL